MGKSAPETSAMTGRGEFDYVYSNQIFMPSVAGAGYRVIVRPLDATIRGQIVVAASSPVKKLHQLEGTVIGFPSATAFVGYAVPMNALLQRGMHITPVFAGNQEGIMGQLKAGRVSAAAVNSTIMRDYAEREHFRYRVLWSSDSYLNLPIAAQRRIPRAEQEAVAAAFVAMANDPKGRQILASCAAVISQKPPYGFVRANDRDYQNYRHYYQTTLVKGFR
jgi:phosphonate transport system substrate-binding protein